MKNQMENKTMTIKEVVEMIINDLGAVEVRMIDFDRYGTPIARAISGLKEICKFWDEQEANMKQQEGPEIDLELVPMEETDNAET